MNLQEYLEPFLAKLPVNEDGDYLKGKTREQAIKAMVGSFFDDSILESRREIAARTVDKKVKDWIDHKGDKLVFIVTTRAAAGTFVFEIISEWASNLTEDKWKVAERRDDAHDSLPRLIRKDSHLQ